MFTDLHLTPCVANTQAFKPLDLLARTLEMHSNTTGVAWREHVWTDAEFGQIVARMAAWLRAKGVGAGDVVSVILTNRPRIVNLDWLMGWLPAIIPADDHAASIAHGDFRLGNPIYHLSKPRVIAVPDWELSTLGHPLADLGYCVMPWNSTPDEYGGIPVMSWAESGIPAQDEFVTEYLAHSLPTAQLKLFHISFAMFRFAVNFVGIADSAREVIARAFSNLGSRT